MRRLRLRPMAALIVLAIVLASTLILRHAVLQGSESTLRLIGAGDRPEDAGLQWQECAITGNEPDWQEASTCLNSTPPTFAEQDRSRLAESTDRGHRLRIGSNVYDTVEYPLPLAMHSLYVLLRNGRPQQVLFGQFTTYAPDRSLQNIGGKAVWEFAAEGRATVILDGADVRRLYGLDAAYAPYEIGGKLIFIGQQGGQRFVVYDGRRIGPPFDQIVIAYCCEPAAYSARGGDGRYAFWGVRHGQRYAVAVSLRGLR